MDAIGSLRTSGTQRLLKRKGPSSTESVSKQLNRLLYFTRLRYPLEFDFCRMTLNELTRMEDAVIKEDKQSPTLFRPIVAIGHTKDLVDFDTVESFLS